MFVVLTLCTFYVMYIYVIFVSVIGNGYIACIFHMCMCVTCVQIYAGCWLFVIVFIGVVFVCLQYVWSVVLCVCVCAVS